MSRRDHCAVGLPAHAGQDDVALIQGAAQLAEQPRACLEPVSLDGAQRHAERPRRVFLAVSSKKTTLDHIGQPRHLFGQPLHRLVERQHALVRIDGQVGDVRQSEVLAAATPLFRKP